LTDPSTLAPTIVSFIRLKHRSTVLLPQPEGPMNAAISLGRTFSVTSRTALNAP
jgi:hypothetical protein